MTEGKALTEDTVITIVSTGGRSARYVWEEEPGPEGGPIAIYFTLGAAITEQPHDAYGKLGDTVSFHVGVSGDATYQWQYWTGSKWSSTSVSGNKTDTISCEVTEARDGNRYRCKIHDSVTGEDFYSEPATLIMQKAISSLDLTINEPTIGEWIYDVTLLDDNGNALDDEAAEALYHCWMDYWFENMHQQECFWDGETYTFNVSACVDWMEDDQGNILSEYYFPEDVSVTVNGRECEVVEWDPTGIYASCDFTVSYPEIAEVAFSFVAPVVGDEYDYTDVVLTWDEDNGVYYLTLEQDQGHLYWVVPSTDPQGTGGDAYTFTVTPGTTCCFMATFFSESALFTEDTVFTVTDDQGNTYTPADVDIVEGGWYVYVLVEYTPSELFAITADPVDYEGALGETFSFSVTAEGTGLTYQWQYWTGKKWASTTLDGNQTDTITGEITAARNGNRYRCRVKNAAGETLYSEPATLTVAAAFAITADPEDFEGALGETFSFSVTAVGEGLTYQWQYWTGSKWASTTLDGNKTDTITGEITAARNGNRYRCRVKNSAGETLYSEPATLSVN